MTLLTVELLTKQFAGRDRPAVNEVSFEVQAGATVGIVGESGSGKSTLARCVAGLIEADSGSVRLNGVEVRRHARSGYCGAICRWCSRTHSRHSARV